MAQRIQIKRSATTATPTSLNPGELAYSNATGGSGVLFIGSTDGGTVVPIAGVRTPGTLTANQALVANSTSGINQIQVGNVVFVGTTQTLSVNGSTGTAGWVLKSGGASSNAYWEAAAASGVTSIATANGIGGGTITSTGTLYAIANNGIVANSTGIWAKQANGIVVDAGGINVLANNGIVSNSSGVFVNGGSTLTVNSSGAHVNTTLSITDLTLSGNLIVSGTLTTVNTTNLSITDPLIKLANGNAADVQDIGIYGTYVSTGTRFTGIFRDASDGIYKLYSNSTVEPTTTVDITATGYTQATLLAYLNSSGLVTNSSVVNITANSSVSSAIAANSLTLTTALVGTSGGTGWTTFTSQDLLVGNTSNGLSKLGIGTEGYVLQVNNSLVAWGILDGGTF